MEVWCGMIVGFDHDDADIFDASASSSSEARIADAMIGMLSAIPKTPLHARLAEEGRLDPADRADVRHQRHPAADEPRGAARRLSQADGRRVRARGLLWTAREPLPRGATDDTSQPGPLLATSPVAAPEDSALFLVQATGLYVRLMHGFPTPTSGANTDGACGGSSKLVANQSVLHIYAIRCAMHYHFHTLIRHMAGGEGPIVNSL